MNGSTAEILKCTSPRCDFYPVRSGHGSRGVSNLKRIKRHCASCSGSNYAVLTCWADDCPVYPYRLGHNPALKGKGQDSEQMARLRSRIKRTRSKSQREGVTDRNSHPTDLI